MHTPRSFLERAWFGLMAYAVKFGIVGLAGWVIDTGIFSLLNKGALPDLPWWQTPLGAKVISSTVAIASNWVANRYWTFREHRRVNYIRELIEYAIVSVGGLLISLLCLWVSHHVLGFTSLWADNISANVVGLILGTLFRFVLYRYWVYGHHRSDGLSNRARTEEGARSLFEEPSDQSATQAEGDARPTVRRFLHTGSVSVQNGAADAGEPVRPAGEQASPPTGETSAPSTA